jgi:hypothetical protein
MPNAGGFIPKRSDLIHQSASGNIAITLGSLDTLPKRLSFRGMTSLPHSKKPSTDRLTLVSELRSSGSSDEPLMTLHQSSLRIRGVLHLLHEALQNGNGIAPTHAAAVCALIANAEVDLTEMDHSIEELIDIHLDRSRR